MKKIKKAFAVLIAIVLIFTGIEVLAAELRTTYPDPNTVPGYRRIDGNTYPINSATKGNCTWYAWGRCYEVTGVKLPIWGNARDWFEGAKASGFATGTTPRPNSIVCWGNPGGNHVAWVESVVSDTNVTWTESNWSGPAFRVCYNKNPKTWTSGFQGYIYINYTPAAPKYGFDVNVTADGVASNVGHDAVTFDVFINGVRAADNAKDFYQEYDAGVNYEVNDIQVSGCWKYTGELLYNGTLNANAAVTLPIVSNHTPETVPGFAATCTATGMTDGEKCSVCGKVLKAQAVVPAYGHSYLTAPVAATCLEPAKTRYTCPRCGDTYTEPASAAWSEWSEERPPADASETEQKTQYRTSKAAAEWQETARGTVDYGTNWPGGFDAGHPLYAQYHVEPVSAKETADERVTVETTQVGYIYWHWCFGSYAYGPINRTISGTRTDKHPQFHAFFSPESRAVTESANAIRFDNGGVCKDTYWWERDPVIVNRCAWVKYERVNGDGWEDFGDWQDEPVEATPSLRVETRTLYRYKASQKLGPHVWDDGVVTVEPLCAANGLKTFTCTVCGEIKTEPIPATGHKAETVKGKSATCIEAGLTDGEKCAVCGAVLKAQTEIPATGHTPGSTPVLEPTCTKAGSTSGTVCFVCGEILKAQEEIPALGHTAPDADGKCSRCGEQIADPPIGTGLRGDANLDGKVLANDARLVLRASAKLETLEGQAFVNCDLNGDGKLLAGEARLILRYSAKLEKKI